MQRSFNLTCAQTCENKNTELDFGLRCGNSRGNVVTTLLCQMSFSLKFAAHVISLFWDRRALTQGLKKQKTKQKKNIESSRSLSRSAITGSLQQVVHCFAPGGGPSRLPALLIAKSCGSVPACDLSVSTASVSITFHSPVDRARQFALATANRRPDLLAEDNAINP